MEWSGQQGSAPQQGNQQGVQPYSGAMPAQGYYQGAAQPAMPHLGQQPPMMGAPASSSMPPAFPSNPLQSIQPIGAPAATSGAMAGMPAMAQQPAAVQTNDNIPDADDTEWVNRAKRAIRSTQGDPHRQVQLIQHLRSQYLKQRFGRSVHTDGS